MSSERKKVKLGDIVDIFTGFPFKSAQYSEDPEDIKLIRGDNIAQGALRWDGVKRWPAEKTETLENFWLKENDVLLAMDRPWIPAGLKFARVYSSDLPCLLVQRVACLRAKNGQDQNFIYSLLSTPAFSEYIQNVTTGTAVPHISVKQIKEFELEKLTLVAEREIGLIHGIVDSRIKLLRETNATLEAIAQALFKSWFVDFDPVHANAGTQAPSLPAEIQALFPSRLLESPHGLIPEGWAYVNLGELVCNQSTTFKFSGIENVVFINTGDVSEGVFLHQNYVPVSGLPGQAKKTIKRDDILFSEIRPKNKRFAYVNIDPQDYVVSTKFMVLRAISEISPRYIYQILKQDSTIDFFNMIAESRSGTFPQITFDSIQNLQVLKPSKACVNQFIDVITPIIEQIDLNAERNKELANLRDSLLPRLISGQLRLPEAQAALAEVAV